MMTKGEEIECKVDPIMNRVIMNIRIRGNCSNLNSSGKQLQERLNQQFQTQQQAEGIVNQARLTFQNRLREMLGENVNIGSFNMTYRYELENQTFGLETGLEILGPASFNGSHYQVKAQWRWINASGECEFEHQQNRHRFNFAEMMGLDFSRYNTPLEQWTRERDMNQNMTRFSLTVPPYDVNTPYGPISVDPTQMIEVPGDAYASGDQILLDPNSIPEFPNTLVLPITLLALAASLVLLKAGRKLSQRKDDARSM
jgi:hypothetical protein